MKRLVCEICGSNDFVKIEGAFLKCQVCGCKYSIEQAQASFNNSVEIVHGKNELIQGIKNAHAQKSIGEYGEMINTLYSMKKYYSGEFVLWKTFFECYCYMLLHSESLYLRKDNSGNNILTELIKSHKNALMLCSSQFEKDRLNKQFEEFCQQWFKACEEGTFNLIKSFTYYSLFDGALLDFCLSFPGAKSILDNSEKRIKAIIEYGIEPDEKGEWIIHQGSEYKFQPRVDETGRRWSPQPGPLFLIGKTYAYVYDNHDGRYIEQVNLTDKFEASDAPIIRSILVDKWNTMQRCPKCGEQLKGLISKRTCRNCKKTYKILKQ